MTKTTKPVIPDLIRNPKVITSNIMGKTIKYTFWISNGLNISIFIGLILSSSTNHPIFDLIESFVEFFLGRLNHDKVLIILCSIAIIASLSSIKKFTVDSSIFEILIMGISHILTILLLFIYFVVRNSIAW